ncbi:HAD family hydrolase [Streptomyces radicis]|uniref:HAD family hydrolase n=1 Tax=Streptomyces radicis TaxID=1750517 RepID=A0A3A9WGQ3_9ACTN|nr:HAD-IA family hydrolase [Streptomyces radicis]RKN11979.1 HAD family hydrolase [Streptomyces radicis]RKN25969.1 HAD family hydrolase [Streptomyces radicis]
MVTVPEPELWNCRAVVFDTDGVITDSAGVHAAAWKEAFDTVPGVDPPFDAGEDYRRHVDGKSRLDGAAAFLAARGIDLPVGNPEDLPGTDSVCAVAARKEDFFVRRLGEGGVDVWPGTVRLLLALHDVGVRCAAVSSSRHARDLLARAGVRSLLQTVVDGNDMARLGLPGKPDPALFLEGARRLSVQAGEAAVVEDALAGVEAGRAGGFRMVIGVDRVGGPTSEDDLLDHGADVVVRDLAQFLTDNDEGGPSGDLATGGA